MSYKTTTDEIKHNFVTGIAINLEVDKKLADSIFVEWLAEHDRELSQQRWEEGFEASKEGNYQLEEGEWKSYGNPYTGSVEVAND